MINFDINLRTTIYLYPKMNLKYFSTIAIGMLSLTVFCSKLQAQEVNTGTQTNGSQAKSNSHAERYSGRNCYN